MIENGALLKNVKFKGIETKNGSKNGKDWSIKEAKLFIEDFGTVKVPVYDRDGGCNFPPDDSKIDLLLSPSKGKFDDFKPVWDSKTIFKEVSK